MTVLAPRCVDREGCMYLAMRAERAGKSDTALVMHWTWIVSLLQHQPSISTVSSLQFLVRTVSSLQSPVSSLQSPVYSQRATAADMSLAHAVVHAQACVLDEPACFYGVHTYGTDTCLSNVLRTTSSADSSPRASSSVLYYPATGPASRYGKGSGTSHVAPRPWHRGTE